MQDPELSALVNKIGYVEGLPVVVDPKIISPKDFIDQVVNKRIPNPFMPDTPQRIATDTSQKLAIRYGETIKAYMKSEELDVDSLTYIPLVFAGWLRYLMGLNDQGEKFELSSDPLLSVLCPVMERVEFGSSQVSAIKEILSNQSIFGVDLYASSLGEKTERYFIEMNAGVGAIRETLKKYL